MILRQVKTCIIILTAIASLAGCGLFPKTGKTSPFQTKNNSKTFPKLLGYVNDFEDILTPEQENELAKLIGAHEKKTTNQIAIVTLTSISPYDNMEQYSLDLANYWGIGQKGKNNGVLIAIGKNLRQIRINNGYGLEARLTDLETKKIIDDKMIPYFKTDNYYEGILKGLEAIIAELEK